MKKCYLLVVLGATLGLGHASAQNVGINSNGLKPDKSAILDLNCTNKGLLLPRMSALQASNNEAAAIRSTGHRRGSRNSN